MRKWRIAAVMVLALLALGGGVALAALVEAGESTKAKGATTITWDSSFQDLTYTDGDTITLTVNWNVDAGTAQYNGFGLKHYTPKSKKDPANGTSVSVVAQSGNSVTVAFAFTELHLDQRRNVEVGNAQLKLYLMVDKDGDGAVESRVGYGVNVHVEDPQ